MTSRKLVLGLTVALMLAGAAAAQEPAAEEAKKNWSNKTEFGLTSTTGNSETLNFSFANEYKRLWERAELSIDAAALRNETTRIDREVGPADELVVTETKEVSAESYFLGGKYRRDITERFLWYVNGSWARIVQAGIDNRYRGGAGVGYAFVKGERHALVGELGGDYTDEEQSNGTSNSFAGARGFLGYDYKIGAGSELSSDLELLENLDDSDDWRVNWISSVTSSLSSRVALKVSYTVLYDNQPVIQIVPDTVPPIQDATFEFDEMDTILTASVVINF